MSSVKLSKCLVNGCSFSTYHVHRLAGSGSSVTTLFNHGGIVFWHNRHPLFHYTSFVCNNFHFYIPQSTNLLLQSISATFPSQKSQLRSRQYPSSLQKTTQPEYFELEQEQQSDFTRQIYTNANAQVLATVTVSTPNISFPFTKKLMYKVSKIYLYFIS